MASTAALAMASTAALAIAAASAAPLPILLVPLWLTMAAVGLSLPNTPALALSRHGELAGSAAALLGAVQFGTASVITPLTGLFSTGDAVGMAVVMAGAVWTAALVLLVLVTPRRLAAIEVDPVPAGAEH